MAKRTVVNKDEPKVVKKTVASRNEKKKVQKTVTRRKNADLAQANLDANTAKEPKIVKKTVKTREEIKSSTEDTGTSRFDIPLKFKKTNVPEFKLPKFKTKTTIPYQPDYGLSILNKPKEEESEQVTYHRYSDSELEEFKEILQKKINETKSELLIVQKQLSQSGREFERTHSMMEDGQINAETEQLTQIARRYAVFIDNLEKALIRVENKTYGVCRATGKLIDKERLRLVPHATLSLEAKMKIAKTKET